MNWYRSGKEKEGRRKEKEAEEKGGEDVFILFILCVCVLYL